MAARERTLNEDHHFDIRSSDIKYMHPITRGAFEALAVHLEGAYTLKVLPVWFRPFETFRTPHRQRKLYNDSRKVTGANAWQSAHQYGLAVDFVVWDANVGWSWRDDHPWQELKKAAEQHGLKVPYSWDRVHVEHPAWQDLREILRGTL